MVSVLLLALGTVAVAQDAPPQQPFHMADRQTISSPFRLALTPQIDGTIAAEEWEEFTTGTMFQWEPGTLYWAGDLPVGSDLILSMDMLADGWLVGDDNYEFRITQGAAGPSVRVRKLDATRPEGPAWMDSGVLPESMDAAQSVTGDRWSVEAEFTPILGLNVEQGQRLGVRVDVVPSTVSLDEAFLPRVMTPVTLTLDQGQALPPGVSWSPQWRVRTIAAGTQFHVRFNFEREAEVAVRSLSFRGEGLAQDGVITATHPFPSFDRRGRARVDYESLLGPRVPLGWRVLRATMHLEDGTTAVMRTSFRASDLVDFEVSFPTDLTGREDAQIVRGSVVLRSQVMGRLNGRFTVSAPAEWTVDRGMDARILIYHNRGSQRIPIQLITPRGASGVFPIVVRAHIGESVIERTVYLYIRP